MSLRQKYNMNEGGGAGCRFINLKFFVNFPELVKLFISFFNQNTLLNAYLGGRKLSNYF